MHRFGLMLLALSLLFPVSGMADATRFDPPLTGDMFRLNVFNPPKELLSQVTVTTENDMQVPLSMYKGRMVLLNIWATWCPPCVKEMPSLNALQFSMDPKRFQVVNVSLDTTGPTAVKDYLTAHNLTTLLPYVDSQQQVQRLPILNKIPGIPISIFIDPQMRALAVFQGDTDWNGKEARAVVDYYAQNVTYEPYIENKF